MARKIGIIGLGHVGSTVAHQIIVSGLVDDLVLIDANEEKLQADGLDYLQAMPNLATKTNIIMNDYDALRNADIIISALGNIGLEEDGNRFAEMVFNIKQVKQVSAKLKALHYPGVLIVITNPCDVITQVYQQFTGFDKHRVFGTGTMLDSARMKTIVGKEFNVDPRSVNGFNLGEHGNSQFTAWSTVSVRGHSMFELNQDGHLDLDALSKQSVVDGDKVFFGKKYTNYAIAAAATRLATIVLNDGNTEVVVSNYRPDFNNYMSYPVIVGRHGIIEDVPIDLTDDEHAKLAKSAKFISDNFNQFKDE
ncbi:NAD(P)-binding domain-containing protein [Nicoliella spurrieriana]|uniref:NAD(P)-binding domain-containing protein n=1 Tax=Nicoliella spurrieriana TaxID=2925830 RepID=A0A976RSZ9_9LACO|nr:NAD(P)-binding domain-containing protein [Nicoliella spurrieriana]UQS87267.1 NAD(P)-binding domain-containing protein [Nicoliella spurrieriana]